LKKKPRAVEQAGAVAVRGRGPKAKVLMVRANKNRRHWIFPKGHIEKGESARAAALRELREEGGVAAQVIRRLGTSVYESGRQQVKVAYFLVRFKRTVHSPEVRELKWRSFQAARKHLTFDDARRLVDKAERLVRIKPSART
jgi:8-oxo-dGTP pyrophosphatase MutT (NUDIX family)